MVLKFVYADDVIFSPLRTPPKTKARNQERCQHHKIVIDMHTLDTFAEEKKKRKEVKKNEITEMAEDSQKMSSGYTVVSIYWYQYLPYS